MKTILLTIRCAVEAPDIGFENVYGISNNTRRWWDLTRARRLLGDESQDDAEVYAGELLTLSPAAWLERIGQQERSKLDLPVMP